MDVIIHQNVILVSYFQQTYHLLLIDSKILHFPYETGEEEKKSMLCRCLNVSKCVCGVVDRCCVEQVLKGQTSSGRGRRWNEELPVQRRALVLWYQMQWRLVLVLNI